MEKKEFLEMLKKEIIIYLENDEDFEKESRKVLEDFYIWINLK